MRKIVSVSVIAALAIALTVGFLSFHSASAATPTPVDNSLSQNAWFGKGFPRGSGDGWRGGITDEELAAALGISTDELSAAYQQANEALLAKAVEMELITQAQADELKANGRVFPFGNRWSGWLNQNGLDYDTFLAEALGISVEELQAAYTQAFEARIDQAVANGKLTQDQADLLKGRRALHTNAAFQASMQAAYEAAVQQAVEDGVITQAQADLLLKEASNMDFGGWRMPGPFGPGHGRHGGWDDEAPMAPAAP